MRPWLRATVDTLCGGCGELMAKGSPMQEIRLQAQLIDRRDGSIGAAINVKDRKLRCARCADGPMPDELPAMPAAVTLEPQRKLRSDMAGIGSMALDWKAKQAGE